MRSIILAAGTAGLISLLTACGGDARPKVIGDGASNSGGRGGSKPNPDPTEGGDGGTGGAADDDPLAPQVKITSPSAVDDLDEGEVVSGAAVKVNCEVRASTATGAADVDESKIKLALLSADGEALDEKPGVATDVANEFSAEFALKDVASGPIGFRCVAEDTKAHAASDKIQTFLDHGPTITFVSPEVNSAHALSEQLDVEFKVEPSPLRSGDKGASVSSVSLELGGREIDLSKSEDGNEPGLFHLQIDLTDPKLFDPAPSGVFPITVKAKNERRPQGVESTATETISVDGQGPVIEIISPKSTVVGGEVKLTLKASDPISRVDLKTLVVSLNDEKNYFSATDDRWNDKGDSIYEFKFDSRQAKGSKVQITVNVTAKDMVGNEAPAASTLLYIDNYPPVLDLDPMNIRQGKTLAGATNCSASFDPLGDAALNDLESVQVLGTFRALIIDETNSTPESTALYPSYTDPDSVQLYMGTNTTQALLIDTNDDNICDEVADVDSTNSVALSALGRAGTPPLGNDDELAPQASLLNCTTSASTPRELLCDKTSDMTYIIQDAITDERVIYAVDPSPSKINCNGSQWEFTSKISPADTAASGGWACFAVRAVDHAGNVGVSRPIRLCIDNPDPKYPVPACATMSVEPPSCTDGCVPAKRLGNTRWYDPR